jgi:hypothetical protein
MNNIAAVNYGTCHGVYIQQTEPRGSVTFERRIPLHDQMEKGWKLELQGSQSYFPFERYTVVGHLGGTVIFFVDGQLSGFKLATSVDWSTLDVQVAKADLKATVTISFSRSWCLWLIALIFLGGGAAFSIFGSWIYRGSGREYIALVTFPLVCAGLRGNVFNHVRAPTIFDMVAAIIFVGCLLVGLFPLPQHPRIRSR